MGAPVGNPTINHALNAVGVAGEYIIENGSKTIIPGALGAMGGWLTGIGGARGMFQGVATGSLYAYVLRPMGRYISNNTVKGTSAEEERDKDRISTKASYFWYTAGAVADVALPILATYYAGDYVLSTAGSYLPGFLGRMITPNQNLEYTVFKGILVNIVPAVTQFAIENLRKENERQKRS